MIYKKTTAKHKIVIFAVVFHLNRKLVSQQNEENKNTEITAFFDVLF